MSRAVELAEVAERIEQFGPLATLVTVTGDGRPHVVSVLVTVDGSRLAVEAGARTSENVRANPAVTLTWMRDDGDYQLIVDGTGVVNEAPVEDGLFIVDIDVESGILHRVAGRDAAGPTCVPLGSSTAR
jgi:hypothetical protein